MSESSQTRSIAGCALAAIAALYVVGVVASELIRHILQTLPLWVSVFLGWRGSARTKWAALPCFIFWLFIMTLIWLFLLGIARIASGRYSPTEIAMTIVVGVASLAGIVTCARLKTAGSAALHAVLFIAMAAFQIGAMYVSLLPAFAHR